MSQLIFVVVVCIINSTRAAGADYLIGSWRAVNLSLVIIERAKSSKQYASTFTTIFFLPISLSWYRESVKDKIKMVLQVILRWKTTFPVKIFIWTDSTKTKICKEWIANSTPRADDNTHVIRSQSSQSKTLNFLTWPDHAFGFVIRDLNEIM